MTTYEIYRQTIKRLPADERLHLARLILDDLSPEPSEVRDRAHLEELLMEGLNSGPGIQATPEYWEQLEKTLVERYEAKQR